MPLSDYKGYRLRNRVFIGFLTIAILSVVTSAALSFVILRDNAKMQSKTDMQNKSQALMASLDYALSHSQVHTYDIPKVLENEIYEIADINKHDIVIYDLKGKYVSPIEDSLMVIKKAPDRYYMRQSAGCDNALGRVVFRFQNAFDIYLHDTPEQQFFDRDVRALSHGCIRIQQAEQFAAILLNLDGQKKNNKILHQAMSSYQVRVFNLIKPIPLKITYLTCEIGENGIVEYPDIYKQDAALEQAFYGIEKAQRVKQVILKNSNY